MSLEFHIRQVQEQLRAKPTSAILEEIVLYKSLLSKGVRDEVHLSCLELEVERRNNFNHVA